MTETVTISVDRFKQLEQIESFFYENIPCYRIKEGYYTFRIYTKDKIAASMNVIINEKDLEIKELKDEKWRWKERLTYIRWYKPWTWQVVRVRYFDLNNK